MKRREVLPRRLRARLGGLTLVASLLILTGSEAWSAPRSLLILPYQSVNLGREERWLGEGVTHVLSLALVNHSAFDLVDPARVKRRGEAETGGEELIRATGQSVRADIVFYGRIKRISGGLLVLPSYLSLEGPSGEVRTLEAVTVPDGKVPEGFKDLPVAYIRALKLPLTETEATQVAKAAVPTESTRAFEAYVKAHRLAREDGQAGNEAAADLLARAVELDPAFVAAQYALGVAHLGLGNRWKAAAQFRASTQLDPTFPEPYKALGDLFLAAPRRLFDQAVEAYQKALELRPFYGDAYVGLGDAQAAKGEIDAAISSYQKALRYNEGNPKVHVSLGKIYYVEKGLYYESVEAYKRAIELDPEFVEARMGLGEVYEDKGLYEDAIGEYGKVIELNPEHTGALYNLAHVYEKVDPREAIARWEHYIRAAVLQPSEKDWVDVARQHLRKLKLKVDKERGR